VGRWEEIGWEVGLGWKEEVEGRRFCWVGPEGERRGVWARFGLPSFRKAKRGKERCGPGFDLGFRPRMLERGIWKKSIPQPSYIDIV
jgi:hypothetical protein